MSSREQLAEELLWILICLGHDPLLHQADLTGDLGDHLRFTAGDRGDDRVAKTERGSRVQPVALLRAATASVSRSAASNETFGLMGPAG